MTTQEFQSVEAAPVIGLHSTLRVAMHKAHRESQAVLLLGLFLGLSQQPLLAASLGTPSPLEQALPCPSTWTGLTVVFPTALLLSKHRNPSDRCFPGFQRACTRGRGEVTSILFRIAVSPAPLAVLSLRPNLATAANNHSC